MDVPDIGFATAGRPGSVGGDGNPSDRLDRTGALFALAGSLLVPAVLLVTGGSLPAAVIVTAGTILLAVTWLRIDWSFTLLLGLVLLMDQDSIPEYRPLTYVVDYFKNLKENSFLPSYSFAVMNPFEIHLLMIVVAGFVARVLGTLRSQSPPAWPAALLLLLGLGFGLWRGLQAGGDLLPAIWEVRALVYLVVLAMLVPQIIRTRRQVMTLLWVCAAAICVKAFQGIARFAERGFSFAGAAVLTNHEDPVFMTTLVILFAGLAAFGVRSLQRSALAALLPALLWGFFTGQRRAAYAGAVMSLLAFAASLPRPHLIRLGKMAAPIAAVVLLYVAVAWNSESRWASPVRLIMTGLSSDAEAAGSRYYSNLYRDFEKYNLAVTFRSSPVFGIGFGRTYQQPIPLADIPFPLRDYIPHNHILWLLTKTGAAGFFLFFVFINAVLLRAASGVAQSGDPYLRAVGALAAAAVVGQLVVSYFDLQLTYYRTMIYLGTLIGLIPAVASPADGRGGELRAA